MITNFKIFDNLRSEYPEILPPYKEEDYPKPVPGFEGGTINPRDPEEKDECEKFFKIAKERNFIETENEIKINVRKLFEDFYMTIYDAKHYYEKFLKKELIGKYISDGFENITNEKEKYEGIIKRITFYYDDWSVFLNLELEGKKYNELGYCKNIITIDKLKSVATKYNL